MCESHCTSWGVSILSQILLRNQWNCQIFNSCLKLATSLNSPTDKIGTTFGSAFAGIDPDWTSLHWFISVSCQTLTILNFQSPIWRLWQLFLCFYRILCVQARTRTVLLCHGIISCLKSEQHCASPSFTTLLFPVACGSHLRFSPGKLILWSCMNPCWSKAARHLSDSRNSTCHFWPSTKGCCDNNYLFQPPHATDTRYQQRFSHWKQRNPSLSSTWTQTRFCQNLFWRTCTFTLRGSAECSQMGKTCRRIPRMITELFCNVFSNHFNACVHGFFFVFMFFCCTKLPVGYREMKVLHKVQSAMITQNNSLCISLLQFVGDQLLIFLPIYWTGRPPVVFIQLNNSSLSVL